jgi:hypothetical protein
MVSSRKWKGPGMVRFDHSSGTEPATAPKEPTTIEWRRATKEGRAGGPRIEERRRWRVDPAQRGTERRAINIARSGQWSTVFRCLVVWWPCTTACAGGRQGSVDVAVGRARVDLGDELAARVDLGLELEVEC